MKVDVETDKNMGLSPTCDREPGSNKKQQPNLTQPQSNRRSKRTKNARSRTDKFGKSTIVVGLQWLMCQLMRDNEPCTKASSGAPYRGRLSADFRIFRGPFLRNQENCENHVATSPSSRGRRTSSIRSKTAPEGRTDSRVGLTSTTSVPENHENHLDYHVATRSSKDLEIREERQIKAPAKTC
ncbi:hypothetical protein EVAR_57331_1 [Eumeta japonica]|uniref:Uncharacterized protein n=1 Tax=Eumeta variegata TaxID=151549 RepID=A0A4C2A0W9_EUMVA|nr:hypothetical protein EVAR_57331_1 [Eumeta japonica]